MPRSIISVLSTCLLAIALQADAEGEIYQWTDARGERHFTTDLAELPANQREAAVARARSVQSSGSPAAPAPTGRVPGLRDSHMTAEAFAAWREHLISLSPGERASGGSDGVWAVLMETGFENGSGTLFVDTDGTADMHFSLGGGVIGGGDIPAIGERARRFVELTDRESKQLFPVAQTPLPTSGEVRFYALTASGVRGAVASREALGSGRHPLSALFLAGHDVITGLREASEAKAAGR